MSPGLNNTPRVFACLTNEKKKHAKPAMAKKGRYSLRIKIMLTILFCAALVQSAFSESESMLSLVQPNYCCQ